MAIPALLICCRLSMTAGSDLAPLVADRAAIERVYHEHRTGNKPSFEVTLSQVTLEKLVRLDLRKEAVLHKAYNLRITPELLNREVERINTTTRAPDMLVEIKAALGNDPTRFAEAFAKPILVERLLRDKFVNDDSLHAPQRREAEQVREQLLATRSRRGHEAQTANAQSSQSHLTSAATNELMGTLVALLRRSHSNEVNEITWQLTARPLETNAPAADEVEVKKRFGPNAQLLSSPRTADQGQKIYFDELPGELQTVLRAQLRQPGDISAVIETPGAFLLYLCREKTSERLSAACLALPKRSYEQWLKEHNNPMP
jgi:hypothetical protein